MQLRSVLKLGNSVAKAAYEKAAALDIHLCDKDIENIAVIAIDAVFRQELKR